MSEAAPMAIRRLPADATAKSTLATQVYQELLGRIIRFELPPYEKISEGAVSDLLGVSRTPAREAIALLADRHFVDVAPQRGSWVAPLRVSDLERSQFMREALEVAFLRRVLERPDRSDLLAGLRKEIQLQTTFIAFGDTGNFYRSDEAFHALLAEFAGRLDVLPEIRRLKDHMDRFRHLMVNGVENLALVIEQHREIADRIEAGDGPGAERALLGHIRRIFNYLGEARALFPDYFEQAGPPGPARGAGENESEGGTT